MLDQLATWATYAYQLAEEAGEKVLFYYHQTEQMIPEYKADDSPLTIADKASHDIITEGLSHFSLDPQGPVPVLSEEGKQVPFIERQSWQRYWCVDPLDGTKEFLTHNDEFAINIALIVDHHPILGVIYIPAQKKGFLAWQGGGAYQVEMGRRQRIMTKRLNSGPLRVLLSRHYGPDTLQPWVPILGQAEVIYQGSALKFCAVAAGEADVFLRLSPTSEWDNAAGQCILEEAGGSVYTPGGIPLSYNRSGTLQQGKFIAVGDKSSDWTTFLRNAWL